MCLTTKTQNDKRLQRLEASSHSFPMFQLFLIAPFSLFSKSTALISFAGLAVILKCKSSSHVGRLRWVWLYLSTLRSLYFVFDLLRLGKTILVWYLIVTLMPLEPLCLICYVYSLGVSYSILTEHTADPVVTWTGARGLVYGASFDPL